MTSSTSSDPLSLLALQCQESHRAWRAAEEWEQAAAWREQYSAYIEELWDMIKPDLTKVARSWMHSNLASDVTTLALSLFTDIVEALPELHIDPQRNVRSYLVSVARHRLIDSWRRESKPPRRPGGDATSDSDLRSGAPDAHMWYGRFTAPDAGALSDPHGGIIDPNSYDAEDRVLAQIDNEQILRAIRAYWPESLSKEDYCIVHMRYMADPQASFRQIAQALGKGWTEDAVRQRHFRVIKATRRYLIDQGLL